MEGRKIILSTCLLLFLLAITTYATDVTACGTINAAGTYTQTADITIAAGNGGKCIYITASNVIFDGNGHTIVSDDTTGNRDICIWIEYSNQNIEVKNTHLSRCRRGMYADVSNSSFHDNVIFVNTSTTGGIGINLARTNPVIVENNSIYGNYIEVNSTTQSVSGLTVSAGGNYTTIENNTIIAKTNTSSSFGIAAPSSAKGLKLSNNSISVWSKTSIAWGLIIYSNESSITNNSINASTVTGTGVAIYTSGASVDYDNFTRNNVYGAGNWSIYFDNAGADFNQVWNNSFANTQRAFTGYAYTISANNYFNNSAMGNYWGDILNTTILDLNGDGIGDYNTPYNWTKGGNVTTYVNDYLPLYANTQHAPSVTINSPAEGSQIARSQNIVFTATDDRNATLACTLYSNETGVFAQEAQNLSTHNNTATTLTMSTSTSYHGTLRVYVNCSDFDASGSLTNQSYVMNYTLEDCTSLNKSINACQLLTCPNTVYNVNTSITATGVNCFIASEKNVTLDCAGFSVAGFGYDTGAYGFYSDQSNTTVKNCYLSDFQPVLELENAPNSQVLNSTLIAWTLGPPVASLIVGNSSNLTISGILVDVSVIHNCTNVSINGITGTSLFLANITGLSLTAADLRGQSAEGTATVTLYNISNASIYKNQLSSSHGDTVPNSIFLLNPNCSNINIFNNYLMAETDGMAGQCSDSFCREAFLNMTGSPIVNITLNTTRQSGVRVDFHNCTGTATDCPALSSYPSIMDCDGQRGCASNIGAPHCQYGDFSGCVCGGTAMACDSLGIDSCPGQIGCSISITPVGGVEIGGNFYEAREFGFDSYSRLCDDANHDGFCDSPFVFSSNDSCTGTPTCPDATSQETCSNGFSFNTLCTWTNCNGITASCSTFTDETTCNSQYPCSWDGANCIDSCVGLAEVDCVPDDCFWNGTECHKGGDCSRWAFDEPTCNSYVGCTWYENFACRGKTTCGTYSNETCDCASLLHVMQTEPEGSSICYGQQSCSLVPSQYSVIDYWPLSDKYSLPSNGGGGDVCLIGQTRCPDGTCRVSCTPTPANPPPPITGLRDILILGIRLTIWLIILAILIILFDYEIVGEGKRFSVLGLAGVVLLVFAVIVEIMPILFGGASP